MKVKMSRKTGIIFKKELKRFFMDRRMVITTVFLPGIMLFSLYALMGIILGNSESAGTMNAASIAEDNGTEIGNIVYTVLPAAVVIFLFAGCLSMASESIAGEKERGTIATILAAPVRRIDIAAGKVLALSIGAALSGISSSAGLAAGLIIYTKSMGMSMEFTEYYIGDLLLIAAVLASAAVMIVGMISIISACAGTVKEAQSYTTPLIILATVACMAVLLFNGSEGQWWRHLIPLYGSVKCLADVLGHSVVWYSPLIVIGLNIGLGLLETCIIARMLDREKMIS